MNVGMGAAGRAVAAMRVGSLMAAGASIAIRQEFKADTCNTGLARKRSSVNLKSWGGN